MRIACVAALSLAAAACADQPAAPTPSRLPFTAGPYQLSITGFDYSADPAVLPCEPAGLPPEGKILTIALIMSRAGDSWVGRSQDDGLEMRIREETADVGRVVLSGTISGVARDSGNAALPARPVEVRFVPQASVTGAAERVVPLALGWIKGSAVFVNTRGDSATCGSVQWILQPR